MQMTRCAPPRVLKTLSRERKLFDEFFSPRGSAFNDFSNGTYVPSVDIYEHGEKLYFEAELPGFEKEHITVDVKGDLLSLSGEVKTEKEEEGRNQYRKERRQQSFTRSFKLPYEVSDAHVQATFRNGILTLTIDKPEQQKAKQIPIT